MSKTRLPGAILKGVPPLPVFGFSKECLEGIVQDIEKLGKKRKRTAGKEVTVAIYKSAWQALLKGERVAALRVFSKDDLLHHQFGDKPEEFIIRVKITPVTT